MEFAGEMIVIATLHRLRIVEVPTTLSPDGRSRPRLWPVFSELPWAAESVMLRWIAKPPIVGGRHKPVPETVG